MHVMHMHQHSLKELHDCDVTAFSARHPKRRMPPVLFATFAGIVPSFGPPLGPLNKDIGRESKQWISCPDGNLPVSGHDVATKERFYR
ncbi:MAG TPA: hypothetical protein PKE65_04115 [Rhizobiaceae bacterium]|nr:hypothetical protein [Rhizobiaceae bacterium]